MKGSSTGHHVMNVATGRECRTQKVTRIPITPLMIRAVETLAKKEGMTSIKIENNFKKIIYHNNARTGIDCLDNTYNSDSDDDDADDYYGRSHVADQDEDPDNEDDFEPIDQSEIDELLADGFEDMPALIDRAPDQPAAAPVPPQARAAPRGPPRMANLCAPCVGNNPCPACVTPPVNYTHYSISGTPDPAPQHI